MFACSACVLVRFCAPGASFLSLLLFIFILFVLREMFLSFFFSYYFTLRSEVETASSQLLLQFKKAHVQELLPAVFFDKMSSAFPSFS